MNQKEITAQAKELMDEFAEALGEISLGDDVGFERDEQVRQENPHESDPEFVERFLKNAPRVKDNLIVAEKKKW